MHQSLDLYTIFVGSIQDVLAGEDVLDAAGKVPDLAKLVPLVYDSGSRSYYGVSVFVAKAFNKDNPLLTRK